MISLNPHRRMVFVPGAMQKPRPLITLRDYAITNTAVRVLCPACGHSRDIEPTSLAATHGYTMPFYKLEHLFRCRTCTGKGLAPLPACFIPILRPPRRDVEGAFAGAVNNIMDEL